LKDLAARYKEQLADDDYPGLESICAAAAMGRSHLHLRLGITASTKDEAVTKLNAFASGEMPRGVHASRSESTGAPRIAFLFTGQGSQYQGMGQALYNTEPVFRQAVDRCNQIASRLLDRSLLDVMYPPAGAESVMTRLRIASQLYSHLSTHWSCF